MVKRVAAPAPWSCCLAPVSGFPVPEVELAPVRELVQRLTFTIQQEGNLSAEVFVQFAHLHVGDGSERLRRHGRDCLPELGLGVWPDREPPELWTAEYFASLGPGEKPRPLMHQVYRLAGSAEARAKASTEMLGRGTIVHVLTPHPTKELLEKCRAILLPPLRTPFTAFSFYVPLLEAASVRAATAPQMEAWLAGVEVYIRESVEDTGVVIIARQPLEPILEKLGAKVER